MDAFADASADASADAFADASADAFADASADEYLEKVTAFVTRFVPSGIEMLMIQHPNAGVQFPAGTVEVGEPVEQAALRETHEETGLPIDRLQILRFIGQRDELPPGATNTILHRTTVYARPDPTSFDWATLPRGAAVILHRREKGYAQITYEEGDRFPNPNYTSYQITGWVPEAALAVSNRRSFYHLTVSAETPARWEQYADNHLFGLFWTPLDTLPEIVPFQRGWYDYITGTLGYRFS